MKGHLLAGEIFELVTGPALEFITHVDVLDRYDLSFRVQGCRNAHVALSATPGVLDVATYDVVIGDNENSMCYINDGIVGLNLNSGECTMNCSELVCSSLVHIYSARRQAPLVCCVCDLKILSSVQNATGVMHQAEENKSVHGSRQHDLLLFTFAEGVQLH